MTITDWGQVIILIVVIVLSLTLSIGALRRAIREGFTRRRIAIFVSGLGILFITYLAYNLGKIQPSDWAQIMLMLGLVAVTGVYALSAARQADASVEMAREMREQRLAMYKPYIMVKIEGSSRGNYFALTMIVSLKNEGHGSAMNAEVFVNHPVFRFNRVRLPYQIAVGESPTRELRLENDENIPGIQQPAIVVANYEDVLGNPWHSTLELHWDAATKDIKPDRMEVGVSGHLS